MVADSDFDGALVLGVARGWLRRRRDAFTRRHLEDLIQETALLTWRARGSLRESERLPAFSRTIAQRLRFHELRRHHRLVVGELESEQSLIDPESEECNPRLYRVGEVWVDAEWLLGALRKALAGLGAPHREVLEAFYSGSSCRDISGRHGLTEGCVKQRLFRARSRVREDLEARARCAGLADVPQPERAAGRPAEREVER